ncbi:DNA mismatch repair protein MutS [bacterium]|nr:DNA mismatch repair protein MutS [bacterium]
MKVNLLYPDRDFSRQEPLPWNGQALLQDLELRVLLDAMAGEDRLVRDVATRCLLARTTNLATLHYRQDVLRDCLRNSQVVREIYALTGELAAGKRRHWLGWASSAVATRTILSSAVQLLEFLVGLMSELCRVGREHAGEFSSEGFARFFTMLETELDEDYFARVRFHLRTLKFRRGVPISAHLGNGNEGAEYVLRRPRSERGGWWRRLVPMRAQAYSFRLDPRDEPGARGLSELRDRGLNLVANAVAQSAHHVESFLEALRTELAFYIGCMNLYEHLVRLGEPVCFPTPAPPGQRRHNFRGLYDPCLALTMDRKVVGNNVDADARDLVIITGANQGGKSVFLRSIGLAQVMMQCGMFVPAESFSANVCSGVFTHYKREEDADMKSGKFDEELSRMSEIVDHITSDALILFNESFSATNEREGSEIARQIVRVLLERRVKVFFVTHLYDFACGFSKARVKNVTFLRAERESDGSRTFHLVEGDPLPTCYGADLYRAIFTTDHPVC